MPRPGANYEGLAVPITDLPLLAMLRTRMRWDQQRQRLLAENVANADTPNYRPHDLAPLRPDQLRQSPTSVALEQTARGHLGASASASSPFKAYQVRGYEVLPSGNSVNIEDEMMKVAANQMDYQTVTTLYTRSLGLIKTALGKR